MEFKNYYQILEVEPEADQKSIKAAYRKLARKYHPDMNSEAGAEDKFKEVAEAYEVLKDPERRGEYDELRRWGGQGRGADDFNVPPDWESNRRYTGEGSRHFEGDFSDFFSSVFSGGAANYQQSASFRGRDAEIEMPIFLEDTLSGAPKMVEYVIPVYENGQVREEVKKLKVTLPRGVSDGERIRLKSQGGPGQGGAPSGDLYLHIRLVPHPLFEVDGHDVYVSLPLAPWEAALGTTIRVPTLDGQVDLAVSANAQTGQKLRIRGKGLPLKSGRGDMYAVLKVVMPPNTSEDVKSLWESLSSAANFDPRPEWGNRK